MSTSSETSRVNFTGDGTVDTFSYTFKIFAEADLICTVRNTTTDVETTLTLTTDYTVTGVGATAGGTVVLVDASQAWVDAEGDLDTGYVLTIRRVPSNIQSTDIRNQGAYYPEGIEDQFDKLAFMAQRQQDEIDRSAKMPETFAIAGFNPDLPPGLTTASTTIMSNTSGDGWATGPTAAAITGAEAEATAAAASAAAALVSENAAAADAALLAAAFYQDAVYITTGTTAPLQANNGTLYVADSSGGAITITLPQISTLTLPFNFSLKLQTSGNAVTINRSSTDTIDGATSKVINVAGEGAHFVADDSASPDDWTAIPFGEEQVGNSALTLDNVGFSVGVAASAATITLTQRDGTTAPTADSPCVVGMDQLDGTYDILTATATANVVIPSTATLGHASSVASDVFIYLIEGTAGVLELAVSSQLQDESALATTVAITTGADINALYSTTQRTSVAIRLIGRWVSSQSSAGSWDSATGNKHTNPDHVKAYHTNYLSVEVNDRTNDKTVTANTAVLTTESLVVPVGKWIAKFDLPARLNDNSSTENICQASAGLHDGSALIAETSAIFARELNADESHFCQLTREHIVTFTTSTTVKVRLICAQTSSGDANLAIEDNDSIAGITGQDGSGFLTFERVK
jgi:hypothetical protein